MVTDSSLTGYGIISNMDWQGGFFIREGEDYAHKNPLLGRDFHIHWFSVELNEWPQEDININFLELIPVYLGLQRLVRIHRNRSITCFSDYLFFSNLYHDKQRY